ncbi:MAG: D-glycerate dehydrogenase [Phycisphaerales bacterium]|nr:D-glycerate dehydrogenase [Phycisphaerales bacterium]
MDNSFISLLRSFPGDVVEALQAQGFTNIYCNPKPEKLDRDRILEVCQGAIGIMIPPGDTSIDATFFDTVGPQLRVVSCYAVGYDKIDLQEASKRNVAIGYTPHAPTEATADCAWLLMLGAARFAAWGDQLVRSKQWQGVGPNDRLGQGLTGKTILIVGAGRIGTAVARRAIAWGMRILYTSNSRKPHLEAAPYYGAYVDLDEGLAIADVVTLHCPLSPTTHHLIDAQRLAKFKPGSILVNTARGPIVDESALVDALKDGPLQAAGLDVYEHEPIVHAGLIELDNVFLLPHLGSATTSARLWMSEIATTNLVAGIQGEPLPYQAL